MARKYIPITIKWISILGVLLVYLVTSAEAASKNFYFPEVRIEVNIHPDGSFTVDEYRTYDFQGSFSWATWWLPLRVRRNGYSYNVTIEDFRILDERAQLLRTELSRTSGRFEAKWYYSARNERRTFHIHYRLKGGIVSYPEASELYWQFIGSGWDKPTGRVIINVHLPEGITSKNDILVYGHGPLTGSSEIVDGEITRFTVDNLRSQQNVEIRVVWPAGLVNGIPSTRHTLESIQREEARFVQETIERIKRAQEAAESKRRGIQRIFFIWGAWLILGPLLWLPFYLYFWKKVGKDYSFDDIPRYYRGLPSDLSPPLVEILLREGRQITPRSFTGTLFDLARRGYIELRDRLVEKKRLFGKKQEYETTAILRKDFLDDAELLPYEVEFLKLLFVTVGVQGSQKGSKLELEDLKDYLKESPKEFQKWYKKWSKMIKAKSKELQFIEPKSMKARNIFMAVTLNLGILTLNPILVVLSGILVPKIKRRGLHWARENELWRALDRFLDDFSTFKDVPPEAYKLWEHYLVFGIIFGNAEKILKMLPVVLKDEKAIVPAWYYGYSRAAFASTGRINSMISSIESLATSIQAASTAAAHYSSGGGGGFSSGGGGGGGGGGGSAG
jgi:uncharacterized membrane protein